jgi:hypothetical protein
MVTRILLALIVMTGVASAQAPKIRIGIYAPSVDFGTAQARLTYVQGLAKAIEQNTGIKTEAQPYASLGALKKDDPDFAIVEGQCYATNLGWTVLANANVGGGTSRQWALFSSAGGTMQALKGKKLAFMQSGCNDNGFIDNAMLESEVDNGFWGARQPANDLAGAVASVSSYKTAQAVFAPIGSEKGLTKVFDTGSVPNPAFVELGGNTLPAGTSAKVAAAVQGYGGGGAISSWSKPQKDPYQGLAGRMQPVRKNGVFATVDNPRMNASSTVLQDVPTLKDPAWVAVRRQYLRASAGRME